MLCYVLVLGVGVIGVGVEMNIGIMAVLSRLWLTVVSCCSVAIGLLFVLGGYRVRPIVVARVSSWILLVRF